MKNREPAKLIENALQRADALRRGEQDTDEVFQWLAESPRHVEELLLAQEVFDEIAELTPQQQAALAAAREDEQMHEVLQGNIVPLRSKEPLTPALSPKGRGSRKRRWFVVGAAASVLLVAGTGWLLRDSRSNTYSTALGEQRVLKLTDGSTVHLNTSSVLEARYTPTARELELVAGEALFKVRREAGRPFRVVINGTVVEAVGTQFDVYRRLHDIKVSVIEGVVQVSRPDKSLPLRLAAGRSVSVDAKGRVASPEQLDADSTAWRERRLVFRGNSLREIADEFNRYNRSPRIEIADEEASAQRFAGTFDVDAPEALMQALALNRTLAARWNNGDILIETRKAP